MKTSKMFCVSFILMAFVLKFLQADADCLHHSKCFEKYLHQIIRINRHFEDSIEACNDENNINRRPPQQLDVEAEIEQQKQTSREACFDLTACNLTKDLFQFFSCHSKQAEQNVNKYFIMHLNASSVAIELSDEYDPEEKEILRCQQAAKRELFLESSTAYKEHMTCLNAI